MKLLLDEMFPPAMAEQLRRSGVDSIAVAERADLRGLPDDIIFEVAQAEGRCIVTENVADYRPIALEALRGGRSHTGLIFTSDRRFPRHDPRTQGRIVSALHGLLSSGFDAGNLEHWLS